MSTLEEFKRQFPDELSCKKHLAAVRWNNNPICPHCSNQRTYWFTNGDFKCASCRNKFTVRVNSIFENSGLSLKKWFMAVYCLAEHEGKQSSRKLARQIGVTQKTAWLMIERLRGLDFDLKIVPSPIAQIETKPVQVDVPQHLLPDILKFLLADREKIRNRLVLIEQAISSIEQVLEIDNICDKTTEA